MTTYEIPDEPAGPVWSQTPDGEDWIKWVRQYSAVGEQMLWIPDGKTYGAEPWWRLLGRGPLTDEDPTITLGVLEGLVLDAARRWEAVQRISCDADHVMAARVGLKDAVQAYNKKRLGTTHQEREGDT